MSPWNRWSCESRSEWGVSVFVTGQIFCPLGVEIKEFWNNLSYGKSGVHDTKFDPSPSLTKVAGIIQNYAPKIYFSPREQRSCEAFVNTVCLQQEKQ